MVKGGIGVNIQNQHIYNLISKGVRVDGRKLDEYRKVVIEKNPIEQPEGSALVKIGNTQVMVGVKLDVGEPFPDSPNEGVLIVGAELSPIASSTFELGPPGEEAIELARIIDRGIRQSKAIDTEKLCITEGEKVWIVYIDIQPLNHDGNLIDASGIASVSALLNAKMPKYEDGKVIYEEKKKNLPVKEKPIPVTFAQMNNKLVIDPNIEEENAMLSRLTISTKENGNICAMQKGGNSGFSMENIEEAIEASIKMGKEIRKLL
jgi:exosome complex component RRP42